MNLKNYYMTKILVSNNFEDYLNLVNDCKIIEPSKYSATPPATWSNYAVEYIPYKICEDIKDNNAVVAIDFSLGEDLKYLLAYHIVTSYDNAVVFYFSDNPTKRLHLQNDYGLFRCKAVKLISTEELNKLFGDDESDLKRFAHAYKTDFNYTICENNYQQFALLDRHQVTNEWGAIKLLLNHQLTLKDIEAGYEIPKTIYFKQKLKEYGIKETSRITFTSYPKHAKITSAKSRLTTNILKLKKILLIDDNANKGWKFALEKIFTSATIDVKINYNEASLISDFSDYDLIFLDLRLPANSSSTSADIKNGLLLIQKIKSNASLHVPLLIFTASQKASTLDQILQAGADAMYVKESIDLLEEESFDNYLDFITEINFLVKKGEELKKYWETILKIKTSFLPEIVDASPLILKSRIIERLEMFYGLIKTNFEQSKFNEDLFNYSSDILSFITLWSILNEIQECFFEKNLEVSYTRIRDSGGSFVNVNLDSWKLKAQVPEKYFIKEKPIFEESINNRGVRVRPHIDYIKREQYSDFQIKKNSPFYEFDTTGFNLRRINYKEKLSLQIAFILMAKNSLKSSPSLTDYLLILKKSNHERNKLYITHGENVNTTFHATLEKNKTLPAHTTFNLFRLVAYLLTGNDSLI